MRGHADRRGGGGAGTGALALARLTAPLSPTPTKSSKKYKRKLKKVLHNTPLQNASFSPTPHERAGEAGATIWKLLCARHFWTSHHVCV